MIISDSVSVAGEHVAKKLPKVACLMAAHNGIFWIEEQVKSIINQHNVQIELFISVDYCNDGTYDWCIEKAKACPNVCVLEYGEVYGSASCNFYRLFSDVDFSNFNYVALADQDDIWEVDHLICSIKEINNNKYDGVSSNLMAFEDNKPQNAFFINKSYEQCKYDHFFESVGAGCTYVLTANLANDFKIFCSKNTDSIVDIFGHDWLIYCFSRENGYSWGALDIIGVNYRQHSNNSMGANAGRNLFKRVKLVYHGWYQDQVVRIVRVVAPEKEILLANPMLRIINFWNFRRRFRDKLILLFFFITGMY
jgi:rhamnosyltransferase